MSAIREDEMDLKKERNACSIIGRGSHTSLETDLRMGI
jgi:hypothetical protein